MGISRPRNSGLLLGLAERINWTLSRSVVQWWEIPFGPWVRSPELVLLYQFRALLILILVLDIDSYISKSVLVFPNSFLNIKKALLHYVLHKAVQMVLEDHLQIVELADNSVVVLLYIHNLDLLVLKLLLQVGDLLLLQFQGLLKLVNRKLELRLCHLKMWVVIVWNSQLLFLRYIGLEVTIIHVSLACRIGR